ncbi:MAG: hypothetical protein WD342_05120 [Verrucomicrobiales bacterium]
MFTEPPPRTRQPPPEPTRIYARISRKTWADQGFPDNLPKRASRDITSSADCRSAVENRRAAKAALADMLFDTLLLVANQHREEPEAVEKYFTPSLA